jgi:F-type H+-transporting ATPase subunit b
MASADHSGGGGLPQLDFDTWPSQILWLLITFGALYFLMRNFALPRLEATIADRDSTISRDLDRAAEFNNRAEKTETAYEAKLAQARAEARGIIDEAKAETAAQMKAALAKADERIAAQLASSEAKLQQIRSEAIAHAETVGIEAAEALAQRFSPAGVDAAVLREAVCVRVRTQLRGKR